MTNSTEARKRPDAKKDGCTFTARRPLWAVQMAEAPTYKGKDWPAGSWYCWDPNTDRFFMMSDDTMKQAYIHLTRMHT